MNIEEYIEKRFGIKTSIPKVAVSEPDVEDTISILRGLKNDMKCIMVCVFQDRALVAAAELSDRYITDRFYQINRLVELISILQQFVRKWDPNPTELDQVNRRVMQLEIEESALKNESDNASKQRLQELQEELANEKRNKQHFNLV